MIAKELVDETIKELGNIEASKAIVLRNLDLMADATNKDCEDMKKDLKRLKTGCTKDLLEREIDNLDEVRKTIKNCSRSVIMKSRYIGEYVYKNISKFVYYIR